MKLKYSLLIFISHFFWILLYFNSSADAPLTKTLPISHGYEIVALPSFLFTKLPNKNEKLQVSIVSEDHKLRMHGLLRTIEEDLTSETGVRAFVEIKKTDLFQIQNSKGIWKIYPSIEIKTAKKRKRGPHEIIF